MNKDKKKFDFNAGFLANLDNADSSHKTAWERLEKLGDLPEAQRLSECEAVIQEGIEAYFNVGRALTIIRDSELYKQNFSSFEDYCKQRWNLARTTAYQWIYAAAAFENVRNCEHLPANEAQIRPLTKLPPEHQQQVWNEVIAESRESGKEITAKMVAEKAAEFKEVEGSGVRKAVVKSSVTITGQWLIENGFTEALRELGFDQVEPEQEFILKQK